MDRSTGAQETVTTDEQPDKAPAKPQKDQPKENSNTQKPKKRLTLGPISDLESHLPSEWWKNLFNAMYLKTDADVVEDQELTTLEVDRIVDVAKIGPSDKILDLCCGQGRHTLELAKRGLANIEGVDNSRSLIRIARGRAKKMGLAIRFHEREVRNLNRLYSEGTFDSILILGNSFGYFDSVEDDVSVLKACHRLLKENKPIVLDITDGEYQRSHFQPRSWEWIDKQHMVCRERSLSKTSDRLITREVVIHSARGVIVDQFYAERLFTQEQLRKLLTEAGFTRITFHDNIVEAGLRSDDPGMMARRFLITAFTPMEYRVPKVSTRKHPALILLGDSSQEDHIQKDNRLTEDDLVAVQRFKDSLEKLKRYEFSYCDDHRVILDKIIKERPTFVINFCDEGFRNDAFKELHIPALLDLLDIPYSGADPACLALCYDKAAVRAIAEQFNIPVPLETFIGVNDTSISMPSDFPVLVKPNYADGSAGITTSSVITDPASLSERVSKLRRELGYLTPVLIQEFLTGKEYSVGIIGNPGLSLTVLPIIEIDYSELEEGMPKICGYEAKWDPKSSYWTQVKFVKTKLSLEERQTMIDYSLLLYERLGCRDYARFDFRADENGTMKLLEVNPNPGWTWDGKLAIMAEFDGIPYHEMLGMIFDAALERAEKMKS
ncbi:MAG: methyltransferase domain-containing protein [Deltaproteobacteria bacterium]|nr:methyltransferase domain-containing protein [Deltaproteobacteria bacterium]